MASEGDQYVVDQALEQQNNDPLFQAKRYAYIIDSANQGGSFSGQMKFDLNTLSSQSQWVDLAEGRVEFPIRIRIDSNGGTSAEITGNEFMATIKNGFHQFVDQVQVELSSTTIQTSQIFTNIDTTFKMLTEWSEDEWKKYGPSLGLGLDDVDVTSDTTASALDSLDNNAQVVSTSAAGRCGFDVTGARNPGYKDRARMLNNGTVLGLLGRSILGTQQISSCAKSNVAVATVAANTAGTAFVLYALAQVRLKDVSDVISKLPPLKNCRGFITVSYNSSEHTLTAGATPATSLAVSNRNLYGRCAPAVADSGTGPSNAPISANANWTMRAEVSGINLNVGSAQPVSTTARLVCPYYVANPTIDRALSMKKTIRYVERFVTEFSIPANGNVNQTLSPGIRNPKKLVLYPYFTGAGSSGNTGFLANPLLSPFDGCPATTSPFAALSKWQVIVGGQPMFQQPVDSDYEVFLQEVSKTGLDGGLNVQQGTGVLDQRKWNQLYRYHCVDIGRRLGGDDGSSKAVQVSLTNSTNCPMNIIAIIHYEREIIVDTATSMVSQMM